MAIYWKIPAFWSLAPETGESRHCVMPTESASVFFLAEMSIGSFRFINKLIRTRALFALQKVFDRFDRDGHFIASLLNVGVDNDTISIGQLNSSTKRARAR